jgi:hypothetical protein
VETNPNLDVVDKNNRYNTNYTQGVDIRYVKSLQLETKESTYSSEKTRWAISSNLYVKKAIAEVQAELALTGQTLPTRATAPISNGYRPEADLTTGQDG